MTLTRTVQVVMHDNLYNFPFWENDRVGSSPDILNWSSQKLERIGWVDLDIF